MVSNDPGNDDFHGDGQSGRNGSRTTRRTRIRRRTWRTTRMRMTTQACLQKLNIATYAFMAVGRYTKFPSGPQTRASRLY